MDLLGNKYDVIATGDFGAKTAHNYKAIKVLGAPATMSLLPNLGDCDDLTGVEISAGDVVSLASGWRSVQKTSGTGVVLAYYFE